MFQTCYLKKFCPACQRLTDHAVCYSHISKISICMECQRSENSSPGEDKMKRSYKIIEHGEVAESAHKKRGVVIVERTTDTGYFGQKPTVDILRMRYPIWDEKHFTASICLDTGETLDHVASKEIARLVDKLVKPVKEEKNE